MACNQCGENRFGNAAQLMCHVVKNHAEFSCGCGRKFMTKSDLLNHKASKKANEKKFACSACCRSFNGQRDLWNHKRDVKHWRDDEREKMRDDLKIFPCDDRCGRIFKSSNGLNAHKRDKSGKFADKEKTCSACSKSFDDPKRLAQHKTDTGHSDKPNSRRKEHIDQFYKKNVALSKRDKKESVEKVDKVLRDIMADVTKSDGGHIYDGNVRKAGSYPIKMKICKADEFDVQIFLNVKPYEIQTRGQIYYRYKAIDPKDGKDNNMNVNRKIENYPNGATIPNGYAVLRCDDKTIPAHLVHDGNLDPRAMKKDLYDKINAAIKPMSGVYLIKHSHGPALTLVIVPGDGGHHISVDITPTVLCTEPASLTRPDTVKAYGPETLRRVEKTGYCLVPKGDEAWLVSNNNMCQTLLSTIDSGNGCRRKVAKILKKETMTCASRSEEGLPGVSSHIIKHAVLWCSEIEGIKDENYWHMSNIDNCLIDKMKRIEDWLRKGKLPDYFNTSVNILAGKDPKVLGHLADYLKARRMELIHM